MRTLRLPQEKLRAPGEPAEEQGCGTGDPGSSMELTQLGTVLLLLLLPGECRLGGTGLGGTGTARRGWAGGSPCARLGLAPIFPIGARADAGFSPLQGAVPRQDSCDGETPAHPHPIGLHATAGL